MEEQFLTLVRSISSVTDIVPASAIRWGSAPQGQSLPYIVLSDVSGVQDIHMNGKNAVTEHRVQVDVYALSYAGCKGAIRALKSALNGYRQDQFRLIQDAGSRDHGLESSGVQTDRPYRISNDYIINWRN